MTPLELFKSWLAAAKIDFEKEKFFARYITYERVPGKVYDHRVEKIDDKQSTTLIVERGYVGFVSYVTFNPEGNLVSVEAYE